MADSAYLLNFLFVTASDGSLLFSKQFESPSEGPLFFVVNLLLSCLKRKQKEEHGGWEVRGVLWSTMEHGRES